MSMNIRPGVPQSNPMLGLLPQQAQQQQRHQLQPALTDQQRFSIPMQHAQVPRPVNVNGGPQLFQQRQPGQMMQPGMPFPPNNPNIVRRVPSQPQMSGVSVPPPGALPMTMQGLAPQYRQQQPALTPQQQHQQQQAVLRQQEILRARHAQQQQQLGPQLMGSLPQQQNFPTIPSQVSSSPRPMHVAGPGQLSQPQQNLAAMGLPPGARPTQEQLALFQSPQFNPGVAQAQNQQRIPSNPRLPFNAAGSPPNMGPPDFAAATRPGSSNGRGPPFLSTPAQQLGEMHNFNQQTGTSAAMPSDAFAQQFAAMQAPRPPSHNGPVRNTTPLSNQQQNQGQIQQSPRQSASFIIPSRPPSQSQHHPQMQQQHGQMQPPTGMQGMHTLQQHQQSQVPGPRPPSGGPPRARTPHMSQPQIPGSAPQMNGGHSSNLPMNVPNRNINPSPLSHASPPNMTSISAPGSALLPPARISQPLSQHNQQQHPAQGSPPGGSQQHSIAARQPQQQGNGSAAPPAPIVHGSMAGPSSAVDAMHPQLIATQQGIPRPVPSMVAPPIGSGQGLMRLLQFSGCLATESKQKLSLSYWNELIRDYFTPNAVMKFTLWKDNQRQEAKPFEIGVPILPRFFLVTAQSGVKSMSFSLDGARERMYAQGHAIVECVSAVWTYRYANGYSVTLKGPLTAHVIVVSAKPHNNEPGSAPVAQNTAPYALKFEDFQFDANLHEKYVAIEQVHGLVQPSEGSSDSGQTGSQSGAGSMAANMPMANGIVSHTQMPSREERFTRGDEPRLTIEHGSIPGEPINAFGIPQATMRCLELAESVAQMADLITHTRDTDLGPKEALRHYANKLRDQGVTLQIPAQPPGGNNNNPPQPPPGPAGSHQFVQFQPPNGIPPSGAHYATSLTSQTLGQGPGPASSGPSNGGSGMMMGVTVNGTMSSHPTPTMVSPPSIPASASNSPQKQHKTIPQPQQSQGGGPTLASTPTASASTPGASGSTASASAGGSTPSLTNASLKRKQGSSDTSSPTVAHAEGGPPNKRQARNNKKRPTVSGT